MSEISYWRARPAAEKVYTEGVKRDEKRNMRILARGVCAAAAMVAVFGVCMGNAELIAIAGMLGILTKYTGKFAE